MEPFSCFMFFLSQLFCSADAFCLVIDKCQVNNYDSISAMTVYFKYCKPKGNNNNYWELSNYSEKNSLITEKPTKQNRLKTKCSILNKTTQN